MKIAQTLTVRCINKYGCPAAIIGGGVSKYQEDKMESILRNVEDRLKIEFDSKAAQQRERPPPA